jgi:hypothetical protein
MTAMRIDHTITADMPDGQALPPFINDGVVWHVVHPLPGARTLWRKISLQPSTTLPGGAAAARPRGVFLGGSRDKNQCQK